MTKPPSIRPTWLNLNGFPASLGASIGRLGTNVHLSDGVGVPHSRLSSAS